MSHLEFDGDELKVSLFDGSERRLGSWQASNFGGPRSDFNAMVNEAYITWIPDGQYPFEPTFRHAPQRHRSAMLDSNDQTYGTLGILRLAPIHYGGQTHVGVGIHAGREHVKDTRVISSKPLVQGQLSTGTAENIISECQRRACMHVA